MATYRTEGLLESIYALQQGAAESGLSDLIERAKKLQEDAATWYIPNASVRFDADYLGALLLASIGRDPRDDEDTHGGVASAQQHALFDEGLSGKLGLAAGDVADTVREETDALGAAAQKAAKVAKEIAYVVAGVVLLVLVVLFWPELRALARRGK